MPFGGSRSRALGPRSKQAAQRSRDRRAPLAPPCQDAARLLRAPERLAAAAEEDGVGPQGEAEEEGRRRGRREDAVEERAGRRRGARGDAVARGEPSPVRREVARQGRSRVRGVDLEAPGEVVGEAVAVEAEARQPVWKSTSELGRRGQT